MQVNARNENAQLCRSSVGGTRFKNREERERFEAEQKQMHDELRERLRQMFV